MSDAFEKLFGQLEDRACISHMDEYGFIVRYSLKGFGFGSLTFSKLADGTTMIDDERTDRDTIKRIMGVLIDQAKTWSEESEDA